MTNTSLMGLSVTKENLHLIEVEGEETQIGVTIHQAGTGESHTAQDIEIPETTEEIDKVHQDPEGDHWNIKEALPLLEG